MSDKLPEHDPKLTFMNENGDELGSLNFSGSALSFEGNAEQSALLFINIVDKLFQERLVHEYARGYEDGKNFTKK